MKKQTIVWTTLPFGVHDNTVRLSVFIAPQLSSDAAKPTLGMFSDLLNWPLRMKDATFKVGFHDPSHPSPDVLLDAHVVGGPEGDEYWKAIFSDSTWVKPFEFADYPDRTIRSYPIRNIVKHVRDTYQKVAVANPSEKPSGDDLSQHFGDFCFYDIPVRTKPTKMSYGAANNQSSTKQQREDRAYKRKPFDKKQRQEYYNSLSQTLAAFFPSSALKKRQAPDKDTKRFHDRIKQDYLYLAQDPTTTLCSNATEALRSLYNQLGEFQYVPPAAPDRTLDFLQMSLYYKPRNAVNENYLPTSWLRQQAKNGKPFYYVGAADRKAGTQSKMSSERTMKNGTQPYTSDLMHEGEVHPYVPALTPKPQYDFHQILNSLNRFPWLLRKLGIVIDLEVEAGSVPKAILGKECQVYVVPSFTSDNEAGVPKTNSFPRTAYLYDNKLFSSAPKNAAAQESLFGMLRLGITDFFDVVTLEPGGSGIKILHTVNSLSRYRARFSPLYTPAGWDLNTMNPESDDNDSNDSLPALRNNGIGVSRHGLAGTMVNTLKSAKQQVSKIVSKQSFVAAHNLAAANAVDATQVLYAEDVTRGWRADYKDTTSSTPWRSIMQRDGTYAFLNNPALDTKISDEGFVSPSASQSSDGSSDDLYAGEMLFEWSGWSLVAPRPAKTLSKDEMKSDGSPDVQDPDAGSAASDGTNIKARFLPTPKTLPRLRYGHMYQVRSRIVDLAGNSWSVDNAPDASVIPKSESEKVSFLRHDVVKTPVVLLRDPLTKKNGSGETEPLSHAETVEHLVIRSNRDISVKDYASAHPPFLPDSLRFLSAPKVDYSFAETHGMFDSRYFDVNKWAELYELITKKDYQFSNAADGGYSCFKADVGTNDTIVVGSFQLPYLPDPLAKGVVLRGLPGTRAEYSGPTITKSAKIIRIRANGSVQNAVDSANLVPKGLVVIEFENADDPAAWLQNYPHNAYICLRLVERGDGDDPTPSWDQSSKTLTVKVAKADVWRVAYSSLLQKQDMDSLFALPSWISKMPASAARNTAIQHMEWSTHWMLTPYRNLMLCHAVQQPLKDPAWYKQSLSRGFGDTTAMLNDESFQVHGPSTIKVDFNAFWELQVDDATFATPQDILKADYDASNVEMKDRLAQASSLPAGDVKVNKVHAQHINVELLHDFKDTKHRLVEYEPVGTTRFREYFPQSGFEFTVKGKRWPKHVLSTKRPEALPLKYIVPVFAWSTEKTEKHIIKTRLAGLRVYMDRPWFSSGSDEKLGVILAPPGTNPDSILGSPVEKMITMWGYDPIWLSKATPSQLFPLSPFFLTKSKDLTDSDMKQGIISGVTFDELSNNTTNQQKYKVDVALHDVFFDRDRQLWYSDIMLAHGESYFPFVRLALCRVQPYSLRLGSQDVYMSRTCQADFMQVMPLRKSTATFDPAQPLKVEVTVEGVSYRASNVGVLESEIELSLEKQTPDMGTEFGWTEVSTIPIDRVNSGILGGYWGGMVTLPTDRQSTRYRIVIKEYEQFYADLFFEDGKSDRQYSRTSTKIERRIVFADTIEI